MKVKEVILQKMEYFVVLEDNQGREVQVFAAKRLHPWEGWEEMIYGNAPDAEYGDDVEPEAEDLVKKAIEKSENEMSKT